MVVIKPGTTTPHTEFEATVYVLSKDEGGRHTPFFQNYRPQFYFRTTDVTGVVTLPEGTEMVMPGDNPPVREPVSRSPWRRVCAGSQAGYRASGYEDHQVIRGGLCPPRTAVGRCGHRRRRPTRATQAPGGRPTPGCARPRGLRHHTKVALRGGGRGASNPIEVAGAWPAAPTRPTAGVGGAQGDARAASGTRRRRRSERGSLVSTVVAGRSADQTRARTVMAGRLASGSTSKVVDSSAQKIVETVTRTHRTSRAVPSYGIKTVISRRTSTGLARALQMRTHKRLIDISTRPPSRRLVDAPRPAGVDIEIKL